MRQELYRDVNENVSTISRAFGEGIPLTIVCECGRRGCLERVRITRDEYEAVRADARHFVVSFGHRSGGLIRSTDRFEVEQPRLH
jgi:hypothetical protein